MHRTNHRGRVFRRAVVALLALVVLVALAPSAGANTKKDLAKAKTKLDALITRINDEQQQLDGLQAKLHAAQADLNASADAIDAAQSQYGILENKIMGIRAAYEHTKAHYRRVRTELNARARQAYEQGPAAEFTFLLGSENLADLSDRVEFMGRLAQDDATLAADVQNQANALAARRTQLQSLLSQQTDQITNLSNQEKLLDAKFNDQQHLVDRQTVLVSSLDADRSQATALYDKLKKKLKAEERAAALAATHGGPTVNDGPGPLYVCPVDNPHAYGDSFGAPRSAGGYHPHAGNDILAPEGTIVRAPFDGVVELDPNTLGGNAIIEHGSQGWIYGAHLSQYGATGPVKTGDIIGYVGNTGDAAGGPTHLHFEWHPDVIPANPYRSIYGYTVIDGSAIDPYPYLNEVC